MSTTVRARVIVDAPLGPLDYRVPEALAAAVRPGVAVRVPLGKRRTGAYVVEVGPSSGGPGVVLKDVEEVDAERPALPPALVEMLLFAADYYLVPAGEVLAAALPERARRLAARWVLGRADVPADADPEVVRVARAHPRGFTAAAVEKALGGTRRAAASRLRRAVERGWLVPAGRRGGGPRLVTVYRRLAGGDPAGLGPRRKAARALLDAMPLEAAVSASDLAARHPDAYRLLRTLERHGLVARDTEAQRLEPAPEPTLEEARPEPTLRQAEAVRALEAALDQGFRCFLLEGVTGSGKTEVYLRLIETALARGRTALVLVPEIALTPQLGARFRARFGADIATFHSGLTVAERRDEWERIASGRARIALGARSAVFLPLEGLGVVIVDEEHDGSFKQEETPRYHARDLAVWRARRAGAVCVLGSATPALESRANAAAGRYGHLLLPERVAARPLPAVECIDLAKAPRVGEGLFTARLAGELERVVAGGEQAILFLNRRGFAPYVYCRDCGAPFRCGDCDVSLTLHRRRDVLLCHYCGFELPTPEVCPSCHGLSLDVVGLGTERLEAELGVLLPGVAVARLDRDTVRRRTDADRELARFRRGEAKVLVGTQMVTKGHDFPGVTLVGVVAADVSLNFPDFRAAERTFQLLTQVAGRAGRGDKPGLVLVQAYEVGHYAVQAAARHDYAGFVEQEMAARRELDYPPFSHLVLCRFEGPDEPAVRREAEAVAAAMRERIAGAEVSVLGPAPAPLARLRGAYRYQVLVKGRQRAALRQVVAAAVGRGKAGVRRIVDVDPLSML